MTKFEFDSNGVGALSDDQIRARMAITGSKRLEIEPFSEQVKTDACPIGYGASSFGYDLRVGSDYRLFTPGSEPIDVLKFDMDSCSRKITCPVLTLPPHGFALAHSIERVRIPDDCIAILIAKSTYARVGVGLNTTPIEPGWEGIITIEIVNYAPRPNKVYSGMGIGQLVFIAGTKDCSIPYHKKKRPLYQGQTAITPPRV